MNKIIAYKPIILLFKKGLTGIILCSLLFAMSCKKAVEAGNPETKIREQSVYNSAGTAAAVLTSLYVDLSLVEIEGVPFIVGLLSDELTLYNAPSAWYRPFYQNDITSDRFIGMWMNIYGKVYVVNAAIEGLNNSTELSTDIKNQLLGEAKFMRAFYHFYLVNLYGDIPLVVTTDYSVNMLLPRTPVKTVYQQIINDLRAADSLMGDKYLDGYVTNETTERLRPTKWAAKTLLARAYLYNEEWAKAEAYASEVINHAALYELLPLNQIFLKNSRETIWALQYVKKSDINAWEGLCFVLPSTGPDGGMYPVYLNDFVLQAFESGDQRKEDWVGVAAGYHFPYKYKAGRLETAEVEYSIVIRLAELYLIRAEARIRQDKIAEGIADLNKLRERATDKTAPPANQLKQLASNLSEEKAMEAVLHERYVELFTEWGHRWLDLKRTNTIDERMKIVTPAKGGGEWRPFQALFPISPDEIKKNPSLRGHQNPGYIE